MANNRRNNTPRPVAAVANTAPDAEKAASNQSSGSWSDGGSDVEQPQGPAAPVADAEAELERLRAELDALRQENLVLSSRPSAPEAPPEGMTVVLPKGDFSIFYGGRTYQFKGGQRVAVPNEVANYLRGQVLTDPATGTEVSFRGDCLFV